jgi:uncharacterized protein
MIYLKIHITPEGEIIAMCDSELLGKKFKEGKLELDLSTYSEFYKGDLVEDDEASDYIKNSRSFYTANIVGEKSVAIFLRKGLVSRKEVRKVKEVPYVHIYTIV